MRRIPLIAAILGLLLTRSAFAWIEYASQIDHFSVNFPGEPDVRETMYRSEYLLDLPARVYSYEDGPNRYSMTVVDFSGTEAKHAERMAKCREELGDGDSCNNPWDTELYGAVEHAVWTLMQQAADVTHFSFTTSDMVAGRQLQLTNTDGSRTFAAIHMHENRLYIMQGTVPRGSPAPGLFQQSLGFIDANGDRIRYRGIYTNGYPAPPSFTYR